MIRLCMSQQLCIRCQQAAFLAVHTVLKMQQRLHHHLHLDLLSLQDDLAAHRLQSEEQLAISPALTKIKCLLLLLLLPSVAGWVMLLHRCCFTCVEGGVSAGLINCHRCCWVNLAERQAVLLGPAALEAISRQLAQPSVGSSRKLCKSRRTVLESPQLQAVCTVSAGTNRHTTVRAPRLVASPPPWRLLCDQLLTTPEPVGHWNALTG